MNSTNSNEMMHNKATQEEEVKTLVWWDIDSCPVPDGYDAGVVRPSIASALTKAGYSGPLTITALGNLKHTLKQRPDVLPAISSSGILLEHLPGGPTHIMNELVFWTWFNRPPANLMLISTAEEYHPLSLSGLQDLGYTILQAFPQSTSAAAASFSSVTGKWWLWESLLKDAADSWETSRQVKRWKCSETGESPCGFCCTLCNFRGRSFEDFTTHLKSRDHVLDEEFGGMVGPPVSRKMEMAKKIDYSDITMLQSKRGSIEVEWDRLSL